MTSTPTTRTASTLLLMLTVLASSSVCTTSTADAFSFQSQTQRQQQQQQPRQFKEGQIDVIRRQTKAGTTSRLTTTAGKKKKKRTTPSTIKKDTTKLGTLTVPTVGIGTISWSSNSFFEIENDDVQNLVDCASEMTSNVNSPLFFDTAERYGSHTKTALGMGYGETEKMISTFLNNNKNNKNPVVVATKFTPLRTSDQRTLH